MSCSIGSVWGLAPLLSIDGSQKTDAFWSCCVQMTKNDVQVTTQPNSCHLGPLDITSMDEGSTRI